METDTLHTILFTAYKIGKKRYSFLTFDEKCIQEDTIRACVQYGHYQEQGRSLTAAADYERLSLTSYALSLQ